MASFIEIKEVLKKVLRITDEVDETSDLVIPIPYYAEDEVSIVLKNDELKAAYEKMMLFSKEKLEMYSDCYREVGFQYLSRVRNNSVGNTFVNDDENKIKYTIGSASVEYCMFVLNSIAEFKKTHDQASLFDVRMKSRAWQRTFFRHREGEQTGISLPRILNINTLRIECEEDTNISILRKYANSFEFLFMYKRSIPLSEFSSIDEMYHLESKGQIIRNKDEEIDNAPKRNFNPEVIDYYKMALESLDPFTSYISYYHVIEHYYDAVFRKKLTETIRDKMTHPDFSYKNETKLYDLAKYIKKHMKSDDDSGKGNELESLKYVLQEYVRIDELKNRIGFFDTDAVNYYQSNCVPFVPFIRDKIAWSDTEGVTTNIANRIYDTRNALVHSKSEQTASQYRPYDNKSELEKELSLIRAVAEIVIINSSEEL